MNDSETHIQPDRGFVQHQNPWLVQQRAGDLHPPHLAAGQFARRVARPVGQFDVLQRARRSAARLTAADAVQRGVVEQVVHDRKIEIECAGLEHHAQPAQRLPGLAETRWPSTSIDPCWVS